MVSLVLKRSFEGFEGVDTWFWKRKEEEKGGNSRESYRYEIYMLLPFILCFSLPLLFADLC